MRTITRGTLSLLCVAGLLVGASRWVETNDQRDVRRDRFAGPERTTDDRQRHRIRLLVTYRPAREVTVTWLIGDHGDDFDRGANLSPHWEETRHNLKPGTLVSLFVDNGVRVGGYVNCEIQQDGVTVRHQQQDDSPPGREVCNLDFTVGGR